MWVESGLKMFNRTKDNDVQKMRQRIEGSGFPNGYAIVILTQ